MKKVVLYTNDAVLKEIFGKAMNDEGIVYYEDQISLGMHFGGGVVPNVLIIDASVDGLEASCKSFEILELICKVKKVLRVLLVPGDGSTHDATRYKVDMVKEKPFDITVFLEEIRQLLK